MANNLLLYIIDTVSPNQEQYAISVPPNATVARAKAAFLRANAISGNRRVSFSFRAENLQDERPLLSYDIKRGDYLHRVVGPDDDVVGGYTFYMQLDRELQHSANSQRRRGRGRSGVGIGNNENDSRGGEGWRGGGYGGGGQQQQPAPSPTRTEWQQRAAAAAPRSRFLSFDRGAEEENKFDERFQLTASPKITRRTHWEDAKNNVERNARKKEDEQRRANFGEVRERGRAFIPRHTCVVGECCISDSSIPCVTTQKVFFFFYLRASTDTSIEKI